jgi:hypothetical protein
MVHSDCIPHQIHLTTAQVRKMGQGLGVNLKHSQMGADKGDVVVMLKPQNARKLLTSFRKSKGMRLQLSPEELDTTIKQGTGFFQMLKKYTGINKTDVIKGAKSIGKKAIKHGSVVAGTAIGAYMGNPMAGAMIGKALGEAGEATIDSIEPTRAGVKLDYRKGISAGKKSIIADAKKVAVEALDEQLDKLPPQYRKIGERALAGEYPDSASAIRDAVNTYARDSGFGLYGGAMVGGDRGMRKMGGRMVKGSPEAKAYMAELRNRKKGGSAVGDWFKKAGKTIEKGFKKDVSKPFMRDVGNPTAKAFTSKDAMSAYKQIGKHAIEQGIPVATALASMAMGDPTGMSGAVVGNIAQQYASKAYTDKVGTGRPRGRPRKIGGASAMLSTPYKQALRLNKSTYGLDLGNFSSDNAPLSSFSTNPRVRPSSTEMTLSPYLSTTAPAMNPFVPTYYSQAGGQSCGYGGRGLYGGGGLF